MKTLLILIFVALSSLASAQQKISHYDQNEVRLTDSTKSYYYIVDNPDPGQPGIAYYTGTRKPRYVEVAGSRKYEFMRTYYYRSGEIMAKGRFIYTVPVGGLSVNYRNGKPHAEFEFPDEPGRLSEDLTFKIVSYWDSVGNEVIKDGNGTVTIELPLLAMQIDQGVGQVTHGWKQGANMKYPPKARRQGIQGKVFVEFVVNKDGAISDVKALKGISPECDVVAVEAVAKSPKWKPGYQRGVPVRQRTVMPLTFKLG